MYLCIVNQCISLSVHALIHTWYSVQVRINLRILTPETERLNVSNHVCEVLLLLKMFALVKVSRSLYHILVWKRKITVLRILLHTSKSFAVSYPCLDIRFVKLVIIFASLLKKLLKCCSCRTMKATPDTSRSGSYSCMYVSMHACVCVHSSIYI